MERQSTDITHTHLDTHTSGHTHRDVTPLTGDLVDLFEHRLVPVFGLFSVLKCRHGDLIHDKRQTLNIFLLLK